MTQIFTSISNLLGTVGTVFLALVALGVVLYIFDAVMGSVRSKQKLKEMELKAAGNSMQLKREKPKYYDCEMVDGVYRAVEPGTAIQPYVPRKKNRKFKGGFRKNYQRKGSWQRSSL